MIEIMTFICQGHDRRAEPRMPLSGDDRKLGASTLEMVHPIIHRAYLEASMREIRTVNGTDFG